MLLGFLPVLLLNGYIFHRILAIPLHQVARNVREIGQLIAQKNIYHCVSTNYHRQIFKKLAWLLTLSIQRAYDYHQTLVNQPKLQARHVVDAVTEVETRSFGNKVKKFLSRFGIRTPRFA